MSNQSQPAAAATPSIDGKKLENILGKVGSDFGAAFSAPVCYMGDKPGLYKAMAFAGPLPHEELARKFTTFIRVTEMPYKRVFECKK
jgi:hypothetical protein